MSLSGSRPASDWSRRLVAVLTSKGVISTEVGEDALSEAGERGQPVAAVLAQHGEVDARVALSELSKLAGMTSVDILEERPMGEAFRLVPQMLAREIGAIGYRLENERLTLACAEPLPNDELRHLAEFLEREMAPCVLADPIGIARIMEAVYPRLGGERASADATTAASGGAGEAAGGYSDASRPVSAPPPPPPPPLPPLPPPPDAAAGIQAAAAGYEAAARRNGNGGDDPYGAAWTGDDERSRPGSAHDLDGSALGTDLDELLGFAVENGASDLHLTNQLPPTIRVDGSLRPVEGHSRLDNETIREMVYRVLTQSLRERFEATKELDTSHTIHGVGRFRLNVFQQRGSVGAVLRAIPHDIPSFESLGLPEIVSSFAELRRGLVLVTGPTGSGKSTTLASLVNIINRTKPLHIMTVEDPIEFLHTHARAIVNQREVGIDTESFAEALRHVLRQDPDVILVGEMRDIETIQTALTAAETGHLVFATLHTQDAPQTIDRIIDVFPTAQQDQVRIQLAGSLEAVVTQQLIISASGLGRVPVAEVMVCTPAIRNLIRSSKTHQIYSMMQTGGNQGMQTMDQGLARAVKAKLISEAVAFDRCHDPNELRDHLKA